MTGLALAAAGVELNQTVADQIIVDELGSQVMVLGVKMSVVPACDLSMFLPHCFLTTVLPKMSVSIPLWLKVLKAFAGVATIGSPLRLNDVFKSTGTPVASPNFSTSR